MPISHRPLLGRICPMATSGPRAIISFLSIHLGFHMLNLPWNGMTKVIKEFPGSDAAELAYERKLFALIGGKKLGEDRTYGLGADYGKYMPQVLDTFSNFETAFANNSSLQAFRYQIAQAYWGHRDWANTRLWLQKMIEKSNGEPTFYTATAKARLQKVEY